MHLVVRTQSDPLGMVAAVSQAVWALDPNQSVSDVKTMEQKLMDSVASRRIGMAQLAIFAGMALILAAAGIYGVVAYAVAQRTPEIGIRVALGAQKKDVLLLVLRQSLQPALLGIAIGIAGAQVLTRLLASQLFSISTTDVMTYAAVSLMLLLVVCVASYVPARRATQVDPLLALRYE